MQRVFKEKLYITKTGIYEIENLMKRLSSRLSGISLQLFLSQSARNSYPYARRSIDKVKRRKRIYGNYYNDI